MLFFEHVGVHAGEPRQPVAGVFQIVDGVDDAGVQVLPEHAGQLLKYIAGVGECELFGQFGFLQLAVEVAKTLREARVRDHGDRLRAAQQTRPGAGVQVLVQGRREHRVLDALRQTLAIDDRVIPKKLPREQL